MASAASVTEKQIASQNQPQRQQPILKCPRCESLNTKFCYYNNYSLSQPRHFCKSCKRYWTRGGTLRNVPIGGGCRRNKRIKRTFTTTTNSTTANQHAVTSVTFGQNLNPNSNPNNLDHSSHLISNNLKPLYGLLQQNPNKYPRFNTNVSRYDLIQPQMISSLGLGFSSSDHEDTSVAHNSSSLVSSYPSLFHGGSTSIDPTLASVLASSLQQQSRFMGFGTYGDHGAGSLVNNFQMEGTKGSTDWNNCFNSQSDNNQIKAVEASDPTSFQWTTTDGDGGEWLDPTTNIGSPVPSLI